MGSKSKGAKGERMLRERMDELGFLALTVPGNRGTFHDFDDQVFGNAERGLLFAAECKFRSRDRFYLQSEQLEILREFAAGFHPDCEPIVCLRWNRDTTWYVRHVADLELTKSGNAGIEPDETRAEWATLEQFIEQRAAPASGGADEDETD